MRSKILDLLREAGDSYLSGEEMAKRLGVSRTAVWKHIQELRRDGYDIVSHSRSGIPCRVRRTRFARKKSRMASARGASAGRSVSIRPSIRQTSRRSGSHSRERRTASSSSLRNRAKGAAASSARSSHRRARESGSQSSCAPTSCRRKRRSVRCCRPSLSRRPQRISA